MSDDEFIRQFEAGTLEAFHHRDHVRMAYLYLRRYPALDAMDRFCRALKNFAARQGHPEKYHETITWANLLLVRERMARAATPQSWHEFCRANADLLDWKNNILKRYYTEQTLASPLARTTFLFPDAPRGG